ncbi:MAG: hypothetical protein AAF389_08840 [Gemmatimonadota bacterium]
MNEPAQTPKDPRVAVTDAIQSLMAARLGRGFVPLAVLFAIGAVGMLGGPGPGFPLALGAVLSSAEMLAYGLRIVQRALERPPRLWMTLAYLASVLPPFYGLYVLGWLGLRTLATGPFGWGTLGAISFCALGVWVLRSWMRVVEIERLAKIMTINLDGQGRHA